MSVESETAPSKVIPEAELRKLRRTFYEVAMVHAEGSRLRRLEVRQEGVDFIMNIAMLGLVSRYKEATADSTPYTGVRFGKQLWIRPLGRYEKREEEVILDLGGDED